MLQTSVPFLPLCQHSAFRGAAQTSRRSRGASLADAAGQHRHLTGFRRGGGRSECGWIGAHPECPPCRLRPALCRLLHPCNARSVLATPIGTGVCNGRPIVCVAYGLSSCRLHRAEHTRTTGHRRLARNYTRILASSLDLSFVGLFALAGLCCFFSLMIAKNDVLMGATDRGGEKGTKAA